MTNQLEALISRAKHIVENGGLLARDTSLALLTALEQSQRANNSAPEILRQLAEEKHKRGEVASATAFNYAASALQKELSK